MPLFTADNERILFVHIPKTGGSSIVVALSRAGYSRTFYNDKLPGDRPEHWTPNRIIPQLDKPPTVTLAVVRDPLDRLRSEYDYQAKPGTINSRHWHSDHDRWVNTMLDLYQADPLACDAHLRPQTDYTNLAGMTVLRYELGLAAIQQHVRRPVQIGVRNAAAQPTPYLQLKRSTLRRFIDVYAADYNLLGYTKPTGG